MILSIGFILAGLGSARAGFAILRVLDPYSEDFFNGLILGAGLTALGGALLGHGVYTLLFPSI